MAPLSYRRVMFFFLHGEEVKLQGSLIAFVGDTPALARVGFKEGVVSAFCVVNVWPQKIKYSY